MIKRAIPLFLALIISAAPCNQAAAKGPDDTRIAIRAVLDRQAQGWNEGDIEEYMAGYCHSDSLRFASGGSVFYGWQATFERYKRRYPDKAAIGLLEFSNLDITLISDDAALVFGQWKLKRENDEPWGLFTLLMKKTDLGWRVVYDHTSSADD